MSFQITPYCEHEEENTLPEHQKFFVGPDSVTQKNLTDTQLSGHLRQLRFSRSKNHAQNQLILNNLLF